MLIRKTLISKLQNSSHLRISASLGRIPFLSRPVMRAHPLPVLHKTPLRLLHKQIDRSSNKYDEEFSKLISDFTHSKLNLLEKIETSQLKVLINNFNKLADIAKTLNEDEKFSLFKKLGSDHVFNLIKEEYCLSLTLHSLSLKKPMEFFEFLGPDHMKRIKIANVSSLLPRVGKEKQQLLDSLDTEQLRTSLDEFELKDVLDQIDIEERFKLLNRLGKDFLVKEVTFSFEKYLLLLPEQDQKHLLDLIGTDYLVKTIKYSFDLTATLNYLHKNNHPSLLDLLGPDHLSKIIQLGFELTDVLEKLNSSDHGQLLASLDRGKLMKINFYSGDREKVKGLLFSEKDKEFFEKNTTTIYPPDRYRRGGSI